MAINVSTTGAQTQSMADVLCVACAPLRGEAMPRNATRLSPKHSPRCVNCRGIQRRLDMALRLKFVERPLAMILQSISSPARQPTSSMVVPAALPGHAHEEPHLRHFTQHPAPAPVCALAHGHAGHRTGPLDHLQAGRQRCVSGAGAPGAARSRPALGGPRLVERIATRRFPLTVRSGAARWVKGGCSPAPAHP